MNNLRGATVVIQNMTVQASEAGARDFVQILETELGRSGLTLAPAAQGA